MRLDHLLSKESHREGGVDVCSLLAVTVVAVTVVAVLVVAVTVVAVVVVVGGVLLSL